MRNYGEPQDGEVGPTERKVWEAARASSAAPTYFPAFGKFLDGGLMANNPTVDCIGEVIDDLIAQDKNPRLGLVVSIGTGNSPRSAIGDVDIPNVNWLDPTDIIDAALSLKNFLKLVIDQVTVSGGRQVERSISWCASMNCPFYRLDLPLEKEIDLAEHKDEIIIDMMFQSLLFSKRMNSQLDAIAQILCSKAELSKTHEMNESGGTMTDQHACIVSGTPSVLV
jgi:calcium-independent phospholipase A2